MKIYLAGPDVFLPDALEIGRRKREICARHGVTGLYPLDNVIDLSAADASLAIFKGNEAMMDASDAIIANLTPFRGPGADAGTVYELGYMAGRGKLCLGYSNDPDRLCDRVARFGDVTTSSDGRLIDAQGLTVEDFGQPDNLMMIHALDLHGCALVVPQTAPADIWHDLTSFEACVRLAADHARQIGLKLADKSDSETSARKRVDVLLVERGLFESRARARAAIDAGLVVADDRPVLKASEVIPADAVLQAEPAHPWVSRGGVKLAGALEQYPIEIEDHVCLDVGASTGGFTEVLLANGASLVFAIDVGHGQLHHSLHGHPKIVSMEETDIRKIREQAPAGAAGCRRDRRQLHLAEGGAAGGAVAGGRADAPARADQAAIRGGAEAFQARHHPQRDGASGNLRRHHGVRGLAGLHRHPGVPLLDQGRRRQYRILPRRAPWLKPNTRHRPCRPSRRRRRRRPAAPASTCPTRSAAKPSRSSTCRVIPTAGG